GKSSESIVTWNVATGTVEREIKRPNLRSWAASIRGTLLATQESDPAIYVWDLGTGQEVCKVSAEKPSPSILAFSADGKSVIFGSGNRLQSFEATTGREIDKPVSLADADAESGYGEGVISPDGSKVCAVMPGNQGASAREFQWASNLRIWDRKSGKRLLGPA